MRSHRHRSYLAFLICLALALGVGLPLVHAEDSSPKTDREAMIESLAAMSGAERRAALKRMSPEDRRGLWFEVQKTLAMQRGQEPLQRGDGLTPNPRAKTQRPIDKAVGSIVYDDGVITNSFGGGAIIGNRFDTAEGNPVLDPGTITEVVAVVVQGPAFTTSSAGFVIEGPQTVGGGAMAIFSTFTGATGTTDTVTFAGLGVSYSSSFFVLFGDFDNSYIPAFGTGTNLGQGHHGVVGYTGGMGPNITSTFDFGGTLNGLVRATGNVLPVELMSFDVE